MADNKITIEIDVEGDASKQIIALIKRFKELETQAPAAIKKTDLAFASFVGNLASVAVQKSIQLIAQGFHSLISFTEEAIKASAEQEAALHELNTAMQLTGNFSERASKELNEFAKSVEKSTIFSDEAILSSLAYSETLTGLSNKQLKEVTTATINYASALGIDLETATRTVSKAIEGNSKALQIQGITVKKGRTEIEQLNNTLAALGRFNGAAEAKAKTFTGAVAQLKNQFNNLQESFGNIIVKNPAVIALLNGLAKIFSTLAETVEKNDRPGKEFVKNILVVALDTLIPLVPLTLTFARAMLEVGRAFAFIRNDRAAFEDLRTSIHDLDKAQGTFEKLKDSLKEVKDEIATTDVSAVLPEQKAAPGGEKVSSAKITEQRIAEIKETQKLNADLAKIDQERNQEEIDANDLKIRQNIVNLQRAGKIELEEKEKLISEQDALEADRTQKEIDNLFAKNAALAEINAGANEEEILANEETLRQIVASKELSATKQIEIEQKLQKAEKERNKKKIEAVSSLFGSLSELQNSGNKELFEIGKAAAIAQATIDGFVAVQDAYAKVPFPFNIIAAAAMAIKTGVQIAGIASTQFKAADGLTEVPAGFPNDSFPARLTSGERVVNAEQNTDLKAFLDDGGAIAAKLDILIGLQSMKQPVIVNVGGETIVDTLQEEIDSGRVLRL